MQEVQLVPEAEQFAQGALHGLHILFEFGQNPPPHELAHVLLIK